MNDNSNKPSKKPEQTAEDKKRAKEAKLVSDTDLARYNLHRLLIEGQDGCSSAKARFVAWQEGPKQFATRVAAATGQ